MIVGFADILQAFNGVLATDNMQDILVGTLSTDFSPKANHFLFDKLLEFVG
jgi:hypothetical protein